MTILNLAITISPLICKKLTSHHCFVLQWRLTPCLSRRLTSRHSIIVAVPCHSSLDPIVFPLLPDLCWVQDIRFTSLSYCCVSLLESILYPTTPPLEARLRVSPSTITSCQCTLRQWQQSQDCSESPSFYAFIDTPRLLIILTDLSKWLIIAACL